MCLRQQRQKQGWKRIFFAIVIASLLVVGMASIQTNPHKLFANIRRSEMKTLTHSQQEKKGEKSSERRKKCAAKTSKRWAREGMRANRRAKSSAMEDNGCDG